MPRSVIGLLISGSSTPDKAVRIASTPGAWVVVTQPCYGRRPTYLLAGMYTPTHLHSVTFSIMAESALSPSPSRGELRAWRSFLSAHARVMRSLEAELLVEQRLS